jgi:phytoene/squalene synthetase
MTSEMRTAALARAITRSASQQTHDIIAWLVDRDLRDQAFRAYAYFRWVDDTIDLASTGCRARLRFAARQRRLLRRLQAGSLPEGLAPEERLLADLVCAARDDHPGLHSYLEKMMAVMEFDATRRGRLIRAEELDRYSDLLSTAVMDALAYFIGHDHVYPSGKGRILAACGAHIAHMLRDTHDDLQAGYFNIPREVLEGQRLSPADVARPAYRAWVRERVILALDCLAEGKRYIRQMGNARSQLAGYLYCARFEAVLRRIERDGYLLRPEPAEKTRPDWGRFVRRQPRPA